MMGFFISTEVTLKGGEKATVYYLSEEGKQFVWKTYGELEVFRSRIETLESNIGTIKKLFAPQLQEWLSKEFLSYIAHMPQDRSFRSWDFTVPLRKKLNLHWKFGDFINNAFDEAVKDGAIEERGSGWYRSKVHIGEVVGKHE